jgi:hypothetical protein
MALADIQTACIVQLSNGDTLGITNGNMYAGCVVYLEHHALQFAYMNATSALANLSEPKPVTGPPYGHAFLHHSHELQLTTTSQATHPTHDLCPSSCHTPLQHSCADNFVQRHLAQQRHAASLLRGKHTCSTLKHKSDTTNSTLRPIKMH